MQRTASSLSVATLASTQTQKATSIIPDPSMTESSNSFHKSKTYRPFNHRGKWYKPTTGLAANNPPSGSNNNSKNGGGNKTPSFPQSGKWWCIFCNARGNHSTLNCTKFPTAAERKKQLGVHCSHCLHSGHKSDDCTNKHACRYCQEIHHSAICFEQFRNKVKVIKVNQHTPLIPTLIARTEPQSIQTFNSEMEKVLIPKLISCTLQIVTPVALPKYTVLVPQVISGNLQSITLQRSPSTNKPQFESTDDTEHGSYASPEKAVLSRTPLESRSSFDAAPSLSLQPKQNLTRNPKLQVSKRVVNLQISHSYRQVSWI